MTFADFEGGDSGGAHSDGADAVGMSLWKAVNASPPPVVPLEGRVSTDVLIVGAGIAGLSLGLHLGERHTDTVVLEAGNDANAATSASAGIIAPQLVRTTPNGVLQSLGADSSSGWISSAAPARPGFSTPSRDNRARALTPNSSRSGARSVMIFA